MSSRARQKIVAAIENHTNKPAKYTGDSAQLVCTHDGAKNYNLSMTDGNDRVLMHCFSRECDPRDILERAGLNITDIYHQPLTPGEKQQHKVVVNERQLRNDFEFELLILLCWISDLNKMLFPIGECDRERVAQAMKRVHKATMHYMEGIK